MIFWAKIINLYMLIRFMMTRMLLVKISMVKMMKNHEKYQGEYFWKPRLEKWL